MSTLAPYRIVYLPVGYAEAADRIVALVERGQLQMQQHWLSREACQSFIDRQPRGLHACYAPTMAIIQDAGAVGPGAPSLVRSLGSITERQDGVCGSGISQEAA